MPGPYYSTMTYTKQQMIAYARMRLGLDHSLSGCEAEQTDGIDSDRLIGYAVRQWYLDVLAKGEEGAVERRPLDVVVATPSGSTGGERLKLPEKAVRVLTVRLNGWHHAVVPLGPEEMDVTIRRQLNAYSAATVRNPVAVETADGHIMAWPSGDGYGAPEVYGTIDDGENLYTFGEGALASLDSYLHKIRITDYASF